MYKCYVITLLIAFSAALSAEVYERRAAISAVSLLAPRAALRAFLRFGRSRNRFFALGNGFSPFFVAFHRFSAVFSRFFAFFPCFLRIFTFGASDRTHLAPRALTAISAVPLLAPRGAYDF